ncbi:hypothetical protein [Kutzneria sp. CA-103260]|uniref:hypothetical protein n=1 Tax=Kutzneria sp. CA-103260 TaxID=2802641 RepID=UPI001BADB7F5|nr:hypothetical protein [Kutzneria sp. CA-103260]QUQ63692.1 Serine hydrolase (FSH1) [Kutzneria sp. CA-103260]
MSEKALRVLCLHGYHGNSRILAGQLQPLRDGLSTPVDFVAVDAPSLAAGDFGWWHGDIPGYRDEFQGWARTRDWLVELFSREGPFDGVLGFSQGAALTGLLPGLSAAELSIGLRFAIMAGGFRSEAPEHRELFAQREAYRIPSFHIIGDTDTVVHPNDSRHLATAFTSPVVVSHPGGHVIAATPHIKSALDDFLAQQRKEG